MEIEVILEMIILEEGGLGLEKDISQVTLEEILEAAVD